MQSVEIEYLPKEESTSSPLVVKILPIARNKYRELLELCHLILVEFSKSYAYPGDLLNPDNENVWANIEKLCNLIPLAGGGKLDVERMSDDDIIRVFFTRSTYRDENGRLTPKEETESYASSELARLNGFSFFRQDGKGLLQKAIAQAELEVSS